MDRAYAAGFVDGEGCITVRRSTNRRPEWNPSMYASITVSQVDPRTLHWLAERWGGTVRPLKRRRGNERDAWEWCIVGRQAYRFLEHTRSLLKSKGEQADNALRLKTMRDARPSPYTGRLKPMTEQEVALQAEVRDEALRLNQRGRLG